MALMTDAQRTEVWAELMRQPAAQVPPAVLKTELRQIVDAVDQFLDANATVINNGIAALEPAWNKLSTSHKAVVFSWVVLQRFVRGV